MIISYKNKPKRVKSSKPEFITKDNYRQFKPSEFVESFINDIDVVIGLKKPMDLDTYDLKYADTADECLPCLGAMAVMNMDLLRPSFSTTMKNDKLYGCIRRLGDAIRRADDINVFSLLIELYPTYCSKLRQIGLRNYTFNSMDGVIYKKSQFNELKKIVEQYVKILQENNL